MNKVMSLVLQGKEPEGRLLHGWALSIPEKVKIPFP